MSVETSAENDVAGEAFYTILVKRERALKAQSAQRDSERQLTEENKRERQKEQAAVLMLKLFGSGERMFFGGFDLHNYAHDIGGYGNNWWLSLYPKKSSTNSDKRQVSFTLQDKTWYFDKVMFNERYLIGYTGDYFKSFAWEQVCLFDICNPKNIFQISIEGCDQFADIDVFAESVFGIVFKADAPIKSGLFDLNLNRISIEGMSGFMHLEQQDDLFCSVEISRRKIHRKMVEKDVTDRVSLAGKRIVLVHVPSRSFIRWSDPSFYGYKVQSMSSVSYRNNLRTIYARGHTFLFVPKSFEVVLDAKSGTFISFDGAFDRYVRGLNEYADDADYLLIHTVDKDVYAVFHRTEAFKYTRTSWACKHMEHCDNPLYGFYHTGERIWRLAKCFSDVESGKYKELIAPNGKRFKEFYEIKKLGTISGNPANWVAALRTEDGWLIVGNDEILVIDGKYLFEKISDVGKDGFRCLLDGQAWYCSWYYGFHFKKLETGHKKSSEEIAEV